MERQHVQDKDAWKKNTAAQLKETRERMQKLSENQLETLTKRTILENEAMAAELKYQSRQVRTWHQTDTISDRHHVRQTPSQTDTMSDGHLIRQTPYQTDTMSDRHDIISDRHYARQTSYCLAVDECIIDHDSSTCKVMHYYDLDLFLHMEAVTVMSSV